MDTFEYYGISFVGFMLKGKSLLDYKNLFSPNIVRRMIKYY